MTATGFPAWSQTAASNATADPTVNWAEGQAPSSLNDSARAMMASLAKNRDDIRGGIITGGTSSAYTVASNQGFASAADLNGNMICFLIHTTNAASATLNVDGIGAYPLVVTLSTPIPAGSLIGGGIYRVTFYSALGEFRLHDFYVNPYNIPLGGGLDFWGATLPNSNFAFANGAAISRTTYATLFGVIGTIYGVGDGSTTFNLPDKTGRVTAMKEASASRLTSTYFGGDSTALGAVGGSQSQTLTTAQLAVTTPAGTISAVTPAGTISAVSSGSDTILVNGNTAQNLQGGTTGFGWSNSPTVKAIQAALSWAGSFTGTPTTPTFTGTSVTPTFTGSATTPTFTGSSFGSGAAHNNVQPTIICNHIIRII